VFENEPRVGELRALVSGLMTLCRRVATLLVPLEESCFLHFENYFYFWMNRSSDRGLLIDACTKGSPKLWLKWSLSTA